MKTLATEASTRLTDEELDQVVGGYWFKKNEYSVSNYNQFGIITSYRSWEADQFIYNGRAISYERANEIVKLGFDVLTSLNSGFDHKNKIGPNEPAFIRAFNQQLKLRYGADWMWNGNTGFYEDEYDL